MVPDNPGDLGLVSTFCGRFRNGTSLESIKEQLKLCFKPYSCQAFHVNSPILIESPFPSKIFDSEDNKTTGRRNIEMFTNLANGSNARDMLASLVDEKEVLKSLQVRSALKNLQMDSDLFKERVEDILTEVDRYS